GGRSGCRAAPGDALQRRRWPGDREREADAGWENNRLRARQRDEQGRYLGKSAKPHEDAEAAGMGDKRERRQTTVARRRWLQPGRLRRSAGFTRRQELRQGPEKASLDRTDRQQEKGRAARRINRRKRYTGLVAGWKKDFVSVEPQGPFVYRRSRSGDEEDHLSRADHESRCWS